MKKALSQVKQLIKKNKTMEKITRHAVALIPYQYRKLDKTFWDYYNFLFELEKKSIDEVQAYQFTQFKKIVENAYQHSSFYRRKYDAVGFHPRDLKNREDIKKIPLLTKEEVRNFPDEMLLSNVSKKSLHLAVTSGTTGKALKLYHDQKIESKEWASICYQWSRVGYRPGDARIELRSIVDNNLDYVYFPDEKVFRVNILKMSEENIHKIVGKIKSLNYGYIHGYPSAVLKFANLIKKNEIDFSPKAVMMASEVIYDWQVEVVDEIFKCSKIAHYGLAEKTALGAWDKDRKYYFMPSYGLLEYDEVNNELIGTSLINEVMPFIRYKMTDSVEGFQPTNTHSNKSLFPVIKVIKGREEDVTYNETGGSVPPAVVTFPFKKLVYVESAKIIQNAIGKFDLVFETKQQTISPQLQEEVGKIIKDLKFIYGNSTDFNVIYIDTIPVDKSGKFRWIECRIKK